MNSNQTDDITCENERSLVVTYAKFKTLDCNRRIETFYTLYIQNTYFFVSIHAYKYH